MFKYRPPKSLICVSPLERERSFHFSRFIQNVIDLVPTRARNWSLWVPLGPERTQKRGLENIHKNRHHKVHQTVWNVLQKEGLKKWSFCDLLGPHPRMVSMASWDKLQGPKTCPNGGLDVDFHWFQYDISIFVGAFFEMPRVFHEHQIHNILFWVYRYVRLG